MILHLEFVANALNRSNAIQAEFFPNVAYVGVYCPIYYITVIAPNIVQYLIAGQHQAFIFNQDFQDFEFFRGNVNFPIFIMCGISRKVYGNIPKPNCAYSRFILAPAEQGRNSFS